jgi:small nuclear ribonucleoprotein G
MGVAVPELKQYMDKKLRLKLNGNRGVVGVLRGFDQFLNLVLDEAHNDVGPDKEPLGMVVVRGNSVQAMEALEHIPQAKRGP